MRLFLSVLLLSGVVTAAPMTNQQATDAGKALGTAQDALITPQINATNANANIQHVTGVPAETVYFGGGKADNFGPGSSKIIACKNGAPNADKWTQQSCDAVNVIAQAPKVRPKFTITRNDPALVREQAVRANPAVTAFGPAGGLGATAATTTSNPNGFGATGSYSGCVTTTTPDPAGKTTQTCVDYLSTTVNQATKCQVSAKSTQTCNKTVAVTISQPPPIPAILVASCGAGFTITGTSCTAPATAANPNFTCASGTLSGTTCNQPAYQPPGSAATASTVTHPPTACAYTAICYADGHVHYSGNIIGYDVSGDCSSLPSTISIFQGAPSAPANFFNYAVYRGGTSCYVFYQTARGITSTVAAWVSGLPNTFTYSCPAGYTISGTTCWPPTVTPPPIAATANYSCPAGSVLSGSTCTPTTPITQTYTCGVGATLVGTTCTFLPLTTKTWTDNCTTLQAKTI